MFHLGYRMLSSVSIFNWFFPHNNWTHCGMLFLAKCWKIYTERMSIAMHCSLPMIASCLLWRIYSHRWFNRCNAGSHESMSKRLWLAIIFPFQYLHFSVISNSVENSLNVAFQIAKSVFDRKYQCALTDQIDLHFQCLKHGKTSSIPKVNTLLQI